MTHRTRLIVDMDCAGQAEATVARDRIWDSLRHLEGIEHFAITEVPRPAEAREHTPAADATEAEQRVSNAAILGVDDAG